MKKLILCGFGLVITAVLVVGNPKSVNGEEKLLNSTNIPVKSLIENTDLTRTLREDRYIEKVEIIGDNMVVSMNLAPSDSGIYTIREGAPDGPPIAHNIDPNSKDINIALSRLSEKENETFFIHYVSSTVAPTVSEIVHEDFYRLIRELAAIYEISPITSSPTEIQGRGKAGQKIKVTLAHLEAGESSKVLGETVVDETGHFYVNNLAFKVPRNKNITVTALGEHDSIEKKVLTQAMSPDENFVIDGNFQNGLGEFFITEKYTLFNQKEGYGNFVTTAGEQERSSYIGVTTFINDIQNNFLQFDVKVRVNRIQPGCLTGTLLIGSGVYTFPVPIPPEKTMIIQESDLGEWKEISIPLSHKYPDDVFGIAGEDIADMDIKDIQISERPPLFSNN